jgi:APA family basic amino acid/polyamine antiporter
MSCAGVIILRRKQPDLERPYRTWGYPVVPVIFVLISGFLVLNTVVSDLRNALIGAGLILTGLPVYLYWKHKFPTT